MTVPSLTRFKVCTKCGCTKPATLEFFQRRKGARHGLRANCRHCMTLRNRDHRKRNRARLVEERKAYYWANREDGMAKAKAWSEANKARKAENDRLYKEENREAIEERRRLHYAANRAAALEDSRQRYEANKAQRIEATRLWAEANPEKVRSYRRKSNAKRRAMLNGAEHEPYTDAEIHALWHTQQGSCVYCQTPLFGEYHVDHVVPISRGGADKLENLALACPHCNRRKHAKPVEEFIAQLKV